MSKREGGGAIRIFVAATSDVRRAGLESVVKSEPDFQLAGSTGTVARFETLARSADADVVLIDCDTLPESFLEAPSGSSLVLLSEANEARAVSRLLRAGVRAILPRESDPEEIVSAIFAAYSGLVLLSASAAESLAAVFRDHEPELADELREEITTREIEILRRLARGLMNKEIAAELRISEHTVKFHISSILDKLGASTRTEAVTIGIRRGLIAI
jgi:two-component system, NarL family, response regulator YdfI